MKQYAHESTWAEFGRFWAKIGREQTFWIFEEKCFFCFPSSINCFAILLKSERLFNIHETLADLWQSDVNKSILKNWKCVEHERNFAKEKKSRDSSGRLRRSRLSSSSTVSTFNRCKLQSKLSYYEIHSGAKYLEQMGLWMNLSQIQSALIISERGGM